MAQRRAPKIASPGVLRVTLTGILAVSDEFGRVRLLLLDARPSGRLDGSWRRLTAAVPAGGGRAVPYEESRGDGVCATVRFVVPAPRRTYWLGVAASLRGRWVSVEATVRPYVTSEFQHGAALDLAALAALPDDRAARRND